MCLGTDTGQVAINAAVSTLICFLDSATSGQQGKLGRIIALDAYQNKGWIVSLQFLSIRARQGSFKMAAHPFPPEKWNPCSPPPLLSYNWKIDSDIEFQKGLQIKKRLIRSLYVIAEANNGNKIWGVQSTGVRGMCWGALGKTGEAGPSHQRRASRLLKWIDMNLSHTGWEYLPVNRVIYPDWQQISRVSFLTSKRASLE